MIYVALGGGEDSTQSAQEERIQPLRKQVSDWVLKKKLRYKETSASSGSVEGSASVVRQENQSEAEPAPDPKDCRQAGSPTWPGSRSVLQQAVQASLAALSFDQAIYIKANSRPEAERQAYALTKLFSDRGYKTVLDQDRRQERILKIKIPDRQQSQNGILRTALSP